MKRARQSRRAAFTLIEMVASAVLTSLMMTGLMSIIWATVRESRQLQIAGVDRFTITILADQMRTDFQNCRGIGIAPDGVLLHGFLGPGSTPGRIAYEIRRVKNRSVLTRTDHHSLELAWFGANRFVIEPLSTADGEDIAPLPETGGLPEAPPSFRVTLMSESGRVLFREVVHHHDS